jgi:hypothetical protein
MDKKIVETNVDEKEWYQECLRVEKRLIINKSSERNEWRMHMDMINTNFKKIKDQKENIVVSLKVISDNLNKKLFKIVNSQNILSNALVEFQDDLLKISDNKRCAEMNIQSLNK